MYPPTKDEQIVNTALVVFINAITMHFDDLRHLGWSIHRKALIADFEEASFEARTDGYLHDNQENLHARIEVKPVVRVDKLRCRRVPRWSLGLRTMPMPLETSCKLSPSTKNCFVC
jgi:hypothetical protein